MSLSMPFRLVVTPPGLTEIDITDTPTGGKGLAPVDILLAAGVSATITTGICTYTQPAHFGAATDLVTVKWVDTGVNKLCHSVIRNQLETGAALSGGTGDTLPVAGETIYIYPETELPVNFIATGLLAILAQAALATGDGAARAYARFKEFDGTSIFYTQVTPLWYWDRTHGRVDAATSGEPLDFPENVGSVAVHGDYLHATQYGGAFRMGGLQT